MLWILLWEVRFVFNYCCVLVYCCNLKDAVRSDSSPTVLSKVRRVVGVPRDEMEEIEVSTML